MPQAPTFSGGEPFTMPSVQHLLQRLFDSGDAARVRQSFDTTTCGYQLSIYIARSIIVLSDHQLPSSVSRSSASE